ncbi:MAG: hypothetical protein A2Y69_15900 [Candidatus Aminicenantes bacterium RBG_13_59_9]|jgi:hypothetical protein|nr:MAG: hypothetical protein A2Y69_15900 [Candidatus Aminicenantes bacterium RBG_13_59_9]OGD31782.1 MAG: hypothetical protein A2V45_10770 [Candidatus Aminicenantes bacterium RBG_19FT_COMBO_58_17]HCS48495.1 AbrB family transcriptional regulator [Candidatus Aminicenantes bacterium]
MLCKRTYKNQVTLPKKIMEDFKDIEYFEAKTQGGRIILEPVKMTSLSDSSLAKARKKIAALGLTEKDIEDAIAWARKD